MDVGTDQACELYSRMLIRSRRRGMERSAAVPENQRNDHQRSPRNVGPRGGAAAVCTGGRIDGWGIRARLHWPLSSRCCRAGIRGFVPPRPTGTALYAVAVQSRIAAWTGADLHGASSYGTLRHSSIYGEPNGRSRSLTIQPGARDIGTSSMPSRRR